MFQKLPFDRQTSLPTLIRTDFPWIDSRRTRRGAFGISAKRHSLRQAPLRKREPPPYDGLQLGESRETIDRDHGLNWDFKSVMGVTGQKGGKSLDLLRRGETALYGETALGQEMGVSPWKLTPVGLDVRFLFLRRAGTVLKDADLDPSAGGMTGSGALSSGSDIAHARDVNPMGRNLVG